VMQLCTTTNRVAAQREFSSRGNDRSCGLI
jgi:hypothetical protein